MTYRRTANRAGLFVCLTAVALLLALGLYLEHQYENRPKPDCTKNVYAVECSRP